MVQVNVMDKENQPMELEPVAEQQVSDLATLRVISDPLRTRLLDLLRAQPQTVKELAASTNMQPKKLYYHINLMEQHALIRVVETRIVSGIIEKRYRATAYLFVFDKSVFASGATTAEGLSESEALLFDTTRTELSQSLLDGVAVAGSDAPMSRQRVMSWQLNRMTEDQANSFYAKLQSVLQEFTMYEQSSGDHEAQGYRLFVTLYPVRRYPTGPERDS